MLFVQSKLYSRFKDRVYVGGLVTDEVYHKIYFFNRHRTVCAKFIEIFVHLPNKWRLFGLML